MSRLLGFSHPDFLLRALTSRQISEWQAYSQLEPIEDWRQDYPFALICSVVVNLFLSVWGPSGGKMTSPRDFLPDWTGERPEQGSADRRQSVEEMKAILYGLAGKRL